MPLLDADRRTVISWSAKSACTHVVIWYLHRLGLLEEAQAHHPWVHRYRGEVLYRSEKYCRAREQLEQEGTLNWSYVKVVRDPVRRCVSSYRHALKHGYENERMSRVLCREVHHETGFSYKIFLEYLDQIDLHNCDIHHRVQKHSLDTAPFARSWLVNIDEQSLDSALSEIDRIQGCSPLAGHGAGVEAIAHAADRHTGYEAGDSDKVADQWRKPLCVHDVRKWPKASLLASREAGEIAAHIYRSDYEMLDLLAGRKQSQ